MHGNSGLEITGLRTAWFSSIYSNPSDLARILIHETLHPSYPWPGTWRSHYLLDQRAREWLMRSGLGGGGCGYGFLMSNAPTGISANMVITQSATYLGGIAVSENVIGSEPGDISIAAARAGPNISASVNGGALVSLPVSPRLYDLHCTE